MRMFENRVLRRIFGPRRDKAPGELCISLVTNTMQYDARYVQRQKKHICYFVHTCVHVASPAHGKILCNPGTALLAK